MTQPQSLGPVIGQNRRGGYTSVKLRNGNGNYMKPEIQMNSSGVESLNSQCFCISVDTDALRHELATNTHTLAISSMFAALPVFVSRKHLDGMAAIIAAVESVIALPAYRQIVLEGASAIAQFDGSGAKGVFLSYDFHLSGAEPKLIEINTNAGGALLSAALARAQKACCSTIADMTTHPIEVEALELTFVSMFLAEWRLARGDKKLRRIAIVDENPKEQYLYPEFILFQKMFQKHGVEAIIANPADLHLHDGVLWHGEEAIDFVYNRLTDFMLVMPSNLVLHDAYLNNAIVLSPHPRVYALYANKRNLALLSDPERLMALGVSDDVARTLLNGIPRTVIVADSDTAQLWSERRKLFFKPATGFGGKAAYRGDKLTKRVWEQIIAGDYIAQALVPAGERLVGDRKAPQTLKFDIRNYVYDGVVQFITARLYQGQTTNFRTLGGGFAPVFTDVDAGFDPVSARCDSQP
jgi:hypothetical protein